MRKIYGMAVRDWNKLAKVLNPITTDYGITTYTVEEYIKNNPGAVTNRRVSKKGTEMVEVTYPTGKVAEYPLNHISTTTAFEY